MYIPIFVLILAIGILFQHDVKVGMGATMMALFVIGISFAMVKRRLPWHWDAIESVKL